MGNGGKIFFSFFFFFEASRGKDINYCSLQINDWELGEVEGLLRRLKGHVINGVEDVTVWWLSKGGTFSVKSFYSSLAGCYPKSFPTSLVWNPWNSSASNVVKKCGVCLIYTEVLEGIHPGNRKQLKSRGCNVVERSSDRAGFNRSGMDSSYSGSHDRPTNHPTLKLKLKL